jgi:hypothetical protein
MLDVFLNSAGNIFRFYLYLFSTYPYVFTGILIAVILGLIFDWIRKDSFTKEIVLIAIFILAALTLIAWITISLITWFSSINVANPVFSQEPNLTQVLNIDIQETSIVMEIIDKEIIPMPNCGNSNVYEYSAELTHKVENQIMLDGQIESDILKLLSVRLQAHYGISTTEARIETRSIHLSANPNTSVEYPVTWKYIWHQGNVNITYTDNTVRSYPYKISKVDSVIENPVSKICTP